MIWILASVLVIGFVGFQYYKSKTVNTEAAAQIRTAVVQQGKLEVKISGSGTVEPVTSEDIKATDDNNEIDEVLVSAGDKVSEGDELITFTDDSDPITAPADGTITTVSVLEGERITKGQVVAHLTDYKNLQTVVAVDELDITKIKKKQTVSLTVSAYPDTTYTGKVTAIAAEGTSANGTSTFDVTIHIDKPTNLKVGMSTEASILTQSKENALYVPVDGVYTNKNEKYVIVTAASTDSSSDASAGTSQQKTVKTGISTDEYVELTEGVTAGETIQLPELAASSSSNRQGGMMRGNMGGVANGGGMPPGGNGQVAPSGRGGN
ncbi:HlyD family efflux transporter periplasmic adaptor subunit [Neobacillus sp. MER 74]|uniref:HlyD family efflux transporter periplasmic adaptor subunit n=1 Tax=Neobacillus sp. MER 74 TaxID=2939566 RepID=UPI00203ACFB4|nr:HlyD family efflux transporter periplasmic adaptor subunit [Neobacillus sp. MER 74]MCM3117131.1 HlyD family efflux transporter periplasmic adaptor subunit [Neobacillus sp. MER 74]